MIPHADRILIIKLRAIGDVILATPVIDNLRAAYPEAEIDFLTEPPAAPIVANHPALHDVLVFDRKADARWGGLAYNARFLAHLRRRRYDLVFDLFGNPRSALMARISGARHRVGFAFRGRKYAYNHVVPPRGDRIHEVLFNLDALQFLDIPIRTSRPRVELSTADRRFADDFWRRHGLEGQRVAGLNCSGGWYTKRWPLASFARLGDRLVADFGLRILLPWGPGELTDVEQVRDLMQHEALVAPPTTLLQLGAMLARLDLLVSNDSGPMHLAAATGTPVVGIYGPTRPELQGPWGEQHSFVRKEGLPCLGCNGVTCKIQTHDCMQQLSVDEVYQQITSAFAARLQRTES